jgi:hypothetical protein
VLYCNVTVRVIVLYSSICCNKSATAKRMA